ncbi:Uncharacterized conserved protein [Bordetella ansorpii]|uniref:Uncharacterized conserved protein n=1 Tax=Bordetella ansorpii TaxID=288768 RepID=A0A157RKI8_9BORD|nr:DUF1428 domain-containing protein [Bordetella ansorpii]SAI57909.1 Uncharacterized conserved protein [Bordetella ansorpii]
MEQEYVDGFLLAVPRENLDRYKKMAQHAGAIWKEHGALDFRECVEDDIVNEGFASFRTAAGAQEGEAVVFSWIRFANKAERDRINAQVMNDPRLKETDCEGVFDFKRMAWGGFGVLVSG